MFTSNFHLILCIALTIWLPDRATSGEHTYVTADGVKFKVENVAVGLSIPWSLAFGGDDLYFTERGGTLWVLQKGATQPSLLQKVDGVHAEGEGGLMGLAPHPRFTDNQLLYLSFTTEFAGSVVNKIVRYKITAKGLGSARTIVDGLPGSGVHNGCRIRFGPDGKLYITAGDAAKREIAQDMSSLGGKILRLNDDGTIPSDNPFPRSPVYSLGHRNSQGLDWHPTKLFLFSTEHGPSGFDGPGGGDEINLVEAGRNYGWPRIHHLQQAEGLAAPILEFTPAIAPSGASFYSGSTLPQFNGDLFVATLRGRKILRIRIDPELGRKVIGTEAILEDEFGRLRDIVMGPDGFLYFCTNNRDGRGSPKTDDDRILRIRPVK